MKSCSDGPSAPGLSLAKPMDPFRLVVISGWSVYPKLDFSLKINISIHNWSSKKICSIRYTKYMHISFWTLRKWLYKRRKKWPKKSAAFGGRLLVPFWGLKYNHFLRVQNEICTYWVYLMEHMFFELQLCFEILIFKEKSNFGYTDHPEITTSLLCMCSIFLTFTDPREFLLIDMLQR